MKKGRIIIILFIMIVFFVNPKTMESIKTYFNNDKIKVIKEISIDSNENAEILNYKNNLIFYDGEYLKALNEKGQKVFDLNIESKDFYIESSKYIDILDKHNKIAYSINNNGTIIFKKQFTKMPISFKSVNEKIFLYHYKYDKKEYIDLYEANNKIKTMPINGTITDLDVVRNNIILTYINTEEDLVSIVDKYDLKGNIVNTNKFKDSMFIETEYLNDKFYCIDTNNIYILNDNLKVKEDINIDNNIKFVENTKKYIVAIDDKNNLIHIDDKLELKKKNIMKYVKGISCYDNSYIVYNDNEIKSIIDNNQHDFDSKIYKIINISDKTIALLQSKKISLLYIN